MCSLSRWIRYVQEREILEDTEKQWEDKLGGKTNKSLISWEEYRNHVFGFIDDDKPESGYNFRQGGNGVFGLPYFTLANSGR